MAAAMKNLMSSIGYRTGLVQLDAITSKSSPAYLTVLAHRSVHSRAEPKDPGNFYVKYNWKTRDQFIITTGTKRRIAESETLQRLQEYGLDLNYISVMHSNLGLYSSFDWDEDIQPRIDFLKGMKFKQETIAEIMSRNPTFFLMPLDEFKETLIEFEAKSGVKMEVLLGNLTLLDSWFPVFRGDEKKAGPEILLQNAEKVNKILTDVYGLNAQEITSVFERMTIVFKLAEDRLTSLHKLLVDVGFSQDEIKQLVVNMPHVLENGKELASSFKYLIEEVGYSKAQIIADPYKLRRADMAKFKPPTHMDRHRVEIVERFDKRNGMTDSTNKNSYISPGLLMGPATKLAKKLGIDYQEFRKKSEEHFGGR